MPFIDNLAKIRAANAHFDISIAKAVIGLVVVVLLAASLVSFSFANTPTLRHFAGYPLCFIGNCLLVWIGLRVNRQYQPRASNVFQNLIFLQLCWSALVILRAFNIEPTRIRDLLGTHWGAMPFLLPILAWCGLSPRIWVSLLRYGIHLLRFGIFYIGILLALKATGSEASFSFISQHVIFLAPLFLFSGFLFSHKYLYLGFVGTLFWAILAFFNDSREIIALNLWYFSCSVVMMLHSPIFSHQKRVLIAIVIGISILLFSFIGFGAVYRSIATTSLDARVTEFFFEGGAFKDSRQGIYEPFFNDLSFFEKIFGRGAVASYDPGDEHLAQAHMKGRQRQHIEIGHLYHMLTGGFIQIILFNSIALGAVFLGIRRSRNRFTYGLAFIILGWVLMMLTAAFPSGNLRYILVWLAIGGCWSRELRSMTTDDFTRLWFYYHDLPGNRMEIIRKYMLSPFQQGIRE
jgi:hypothetical protein